MLSDKSFIVKKRVCLLLIFVINFLFTAKYLSRVTDHYWWISAIVGFLLTALLTINFSQIKYGSFLKYFNVGVVVGFILIFAYIFNLYPVERLNVDRWSVITSFWQTFESGEYVYLAKSNVGNPPGPMPFYYILALPFYLIGELGFFSLIGLLAFILLLKYSQVKTYKITIAILFLILSPFYLWELVSRSNILLNAVLVLLSIAYFFKEDTVDKKRLIMSGIFFGLLLSTRNVFVIAYIIAGIYAIRSNRLDWNKIMILGLISISVFILTFIPFIYNHFTEFLQINPFIVQSTFLIPFYYTFSFIVLAFVLSFCCKSVHDVYFYSGLTLFVSIAIYLVYHIFLFGIEEAYFNSSADISYFILSIPFALYYYLADGIKKAAK